MHRRHAIISDAPPGATEKARFLVTVTGTVQGVGFRPFVYGLAAAHSLKGTVFNSARGVIIDVEGNEPDLRLFVEELTLRPPRLSRIADCTVNRVPVVGYTSFEILKSASAGENTCLVPPDVATCSACREDILSLRDRHYRYPFTNCTNCGPRFTITKEIPYDRLKTSMAEFVMCDACAKEYHNPLDRRFHAQPVACPECGPHVYLTDRDGRRHGVEDNWMEACWDILGEGRILALKGIGGFHLACDAHNRQAVETLRIRKGRGAKPLAVMCRDLKTIEEYCLMGPEERELIASPRAPIVILRRKGDFNLPESLAPGLNTLGVMIPYSPFHILLFNGPFRALVMTSGNYSSFPLAKDNEEALTRLGGIADYFLLHDREIVNRCDDSLIQVVDGQAQFVRRSRGYVPDPIPVPRAGTELPVVLGIGGEMKNNFCLLKDSQAFMSQYIGEIEHVEGENNLLDSLHNFERLIGLNPEVVAFDMHPGYASAEAASRVPAAAHVPVQHHHAHLASCMAENMTGNEDVIGIILDGTGYGTDGHLWGFEFLTGNYTGFTRRLHLAYVPLPGGEAAIKEPWRTGYSFLATFLGDEGRRHGEALFGDRDLRTMDRMISTGFMSPLASGAGRLFDAVSAILGICTCNSYEGQAAIELGEYTYAGRSQNFNLEPYQFDIANDLIIPSRLIKAIAEDRLSGAPLPVISTRFHLAMVEIVKNGSVRLREDTGITKVALSGGTWQNPFLFRRAVSALRELGFEVLYHREVPANDGGIALGQAMIAHWKLRNGG